MNKLLLIGNGFDRAHGLPSSYEDFMFKYLKTCFETLSRSKEEVIDNDLFILRRMKPATTVEIKNASFFKTFIVDKRGRHIYASDDIKSGLLFWFQPKSAFAHTLIINCCDKRWVEIENIFYEELVAVYKRSGNEAEVELLNSQLDFLKVELGKYLFGLDPVPRMPEYEKIFNKLPMVGGHEIYLDKSLILNFNYTYVGKMYESIEVKSVYIHGDLTDPYNPLIFGYGDELDEMYKAFKRDEKYGYSKHLKSNLYTWTNSFHQLSAFWVILMFRLKRLKYLYLDIPAADPTGLF